MATETIKYPNRLRECIKANGYKIQDVADETAIPLRSLTEYCAGKAVIPRERLEKLAALLGYPLEHLVPTLSHALVTPLLWSVPHQRNPYFTGREALLQQLHHTLTTSKAAALTHLKRLVVSVALARHNWHWNTLIAIIRSIKRSSG